MSEKAPNWSEALIVTDDPALQKRLGGWLETAGYEIQYAADDRQAIEAIRACCPQIMIVEWDVSQAGPLELCRWLRRQELPHYVYTILITSHCSSAETVIAVEAGADDFLQKPVDEGELLARVRSGSRILELQSRLSELARSDPLTGLATRRTFYELMDGQWSRALTHQIPLSCVMVDIDFFKRINDTYGHRVGDRALRAVARIIQESCRNGDTPVRYGGEEFCVLLPETTEKDAVEWAEGVRRRIAEHTELIENREISLTASFGVAQRLADTDSPEALVDLADEALLVAKRSGRDRVVGFQSIAASSSMDQETAGLGAFFDGVVAKHVMASIVAGLNEGDTVGRAAQYFLRFRFNSAPVVDDQGKLVGILSERDVMSIMLCPRWWTTPIREVMKRNVVCYEEDAPVQLIYEFLCRVSLRAVVIVKDGQPTGIISRGSVLRWFTNMLAVNPGSMWDGPVKQLEGVRPDEAPGYDPLEKVTMIAGELIDESKNLDTHVQRRGADVVPVVVGGVSRMEELLNCLLSYSHYAHAAGNSPGAGKASQETVQGLSALMGSTAAPNAESDQS